MTPPVETGYAKLNLALHVRAREADGYHAIETLFAFVDAGDRLALTAEAGLTIDGPFGEGLVADASNLVLRAADAYRAAFGGAEAGFALTKTLPVAAGIGGGSADAGAALRLLCARDGRDAGSAAMLALAAGLGADVPACLVSRSVRGEGRGDRLERAGDALAGMAVLLVNPRVAMPTGPVFAGWDGVDRGPLAQGDLLAAAQAGRNDLEPPARVLRPEVGAVLAALGSQAGAVLVRMSGSGATCFGLFARGQDRDRAAEAVAQAHPDWWQLSGALR